MHGISIAISLMRHQNRFYEFFHLRLTNKTSLSSCRLNSRPQDNNFGAFQIAACESNAYMHKELKGLGGDCNFLGIRKQYNHASGKYHHGNHQNLKASGFAVDVFRIKFSICKVPFCGIQPCVLHAS